MPTLFSYCIPIDDGAAPNPYWGICTLVICKPKIRLTAEEGDWVVGTGSVNSPIGDVSGCVVYAMKITRKMTMREYDAFTASRLTQKLPDWKNLDIRRRLGDSIYDFSENAVKQRKGVHSKGNMSTDLSGQFALLSRHFFYFGDKPKRLPRTLMPIVKQGQAHRSKSNSPYVESFVKWIHSLVIKKNAIIGRPQVDLFSNEKLVAKCANACRQEGERDQRINSC